jgi:hypothetical protein
MLDFIVIDLKCYLDTYSYRCRHASDQTDTLHVLTLAIPPFVKELTEFHVCRTE